MDVDVCSFHRVVHGMATSTTVTPADAEAALEAEQTQGERDNAPPSRVGQLHYLYTQPMLFLQGEDGSIEALWQPEEAKGGDWVANMQRGLVAAFHMHMPPAAAPEGAARVHSVIDDTDETGRFTARYLTLTKVPANP